MKLETLCFIDLFLLLGLWMTLKFTIKNAVREVLLEESIITHEIATKEEVEQK